ncbi:succinyldiaminopimelate transaminase [Helicobacter sp. MIT 14-3879]|uniref:succinyldiaminopimelate transaminase n=1 Tax=Helicobacter sp. MIT 14-3879 TaxID=2040649 RepID=UPI000E1E5FA9|nr:succinyldiaminopimelate transaminase [Helicobacter sp. MIT 14-3879]RDU63122.1 succinyldiaminopimelate transaminase [Helicobacter sp. MIT 14-3879]
MNFQPYPFEKLNNLIKNINPKKDVFKLTIGEPQFPTPSFIQDEFIASSSLLSKYPVSSGESFLRKSQINFIKKRFNVKINNDEIIPTFGTREVLFNFPCFLFNFIFRNNSDKVMAFPNPFYQIYEGAAIASNAQIIYMKIDSSNNFKPKLSNNDLKKVKLVILNSPNNPTGQVLSLDELKEWVRLALEYDFILLNDECYSDIYENTPPHSILEASLAVGNKEFKNIFCINSISKRSSAPGLRSGFIAGDKVILKQYSLYRTYIGCAIPLPLQRASSVAWESSSEVFRKKYATNLKLAREILNINISGYTFYIWLKIDDDLLFTKRLYENEGILVLPGRFLGREGVGEGFVRIALVYDYQVTRNVLERLKLWI